jgi:hypothetical protein
MDIQFQKDQVHSYCMALKILNSQPNVSIIVATQDMFKDYGNMIDGFYSNFEPGTIRINHIFKVEMIDDTALEIQCLTHDGSSVVRQSMIKRGKTLLQEQLNLLKSYPLETLKPPGLLMIKQVEIYKKWRQYVDPQYWEEMYPKPYDEVMEQVNNDKSIKKKKTTKQANVSVSEKQQEQMRKKSEKAEERHTKIFLGKGRRDRRSIGLHKRKRANTKKTKRRTKEKNQPSRKKYSALQKRLTRENIHKRPNNSANDRKLNQLPKYFFQFSVAKTYGLHSKSLIYRQSLYIQ